ERSATPPRTPPFNSTETPPEIPRRHRQLTLTILHRNVTARGKERSRQSLGKAHAVDRRKLRRDRLPDVALVLGYPQGTCPCVEDKALLVHAHQMHRGSFSPFPV